MLICCIDFHEKRGQLWIKKYLDKPITRSLLRYVGGKDAVEYWAAVGNRKVCLKLEEFLVGAKRRYVRIKSFQLN
jgi:hypothetical protein